jgi:hypothetical protein
MFFLSGPATASKQDAEKVRQGVLASLRGSTYRSVRLTSLLAAALLDGLFEHPAGVLLLSRRTDQ